MFVREMPIIIWSQCVAIQYDRSRKQHDTLDFKIDLDSRHKFLFGFHDSLYRLYIVYGV